MTYDFDALLDMAGKEFGITQVRDEIKALIDCVNLMKPTTVVEIGTHKGGNSFLFMHAVRSSELVIGLDLCVQNSGKLKYFAGPHQRFKVIHCNSQTLASFNRVNRALGGRAIDFLFIDGDHSYAGAKADFELYSPLVRSGGLIAFHDILADHRTRFGRETGCYAGDVHRLWAELRESNRDCEEFVADRQQDGFGIGVINWHG